MASAVLLFGALKPNSILSLICRSAGSFLLCNYSLKTIYGKYLIDQNYILCYIISGLEICAWEYQNAVSKFVPVKYRKLNLRHSLLRLRKT